MRKVRLDERVVDRIVGQSRLLKPAHELVHRAPEQRLIGGERSLELFRQRHWK
jgi:hypothetical protein